MFDLLFYCYCSSLKTDYPYHHHLATHSWALFNGWWSLTGSRFAACYNWFPQITEVLKVFLFPPLSLTFAFQMYAYLIKSARCLLHSSDSRCCTLDEWTRYLGVRLYYYSYWHRHWFWLSMHMIVVILLAHFSMLMWSFKHYCCLRTQE